MFKLGEYCEEDARSIADHLGRVGIRVKLRQSIDASLEVEDYLQGRFSELAVEVEDKDLVKTHKRYLDALKKILLSKPSYADFEEMYIRELFPSMDEKKKLLDELLEDLHKYTEEDDGTADSNQQPAQPIDQKGGFEKAPRRLSAELVVKAREAISDAAAFIDEGTKARDFALAVLSLNDIKIGEDLGERLADPVVPIQVDINDYGGDHPKAKKEISVYLDKCYDLYVDEFSVFLQKRKPDSEFMRNYIDENIKIMSLKLLIADMIENHSSDRMDFETFKNECQSYGDMGMTIMEIYGHSVAGELAKVLEKNEIIRIKGDKIKWKK